MDPFVGICLLVVAIFGVAALRIQHDRMIREMIDRGLIQRKPLQFSRRARYNR